MNTLKILQYCTKQVKPCGWPEFLELIRQLIQFAFFLAGIFATISIAYAGWLYLTSGGNAGAREKAHGILWNVVYGLVFVFTAFIIVQFILKGFGLDPSYTLLRG